MDNDGKRLIARYYTDDFPTVREQKVCSTQGILPNENSQEIHFPRRKIKIFELDKNFRHLKRKFLTKQRSEMTKFFC